jgi:hypothetical protein
MRLTLRTLLSYLDDTLDPTQARLIGQKVAESEVAQKLIERIKDVIRQRRLTVPPATGPAAKLDINSLAEYLDNELPPDRLAEVEEIALESDVYLAELAACHQILTLVLGEPARVPLPARQRMYALGKGRAAPARRPAGDGSSADDLALIGSGTPPAAASAASADGRPLLRRLAPLAGIVAVLVALGVVIWKVALPNNPETIAHADSAKDRRPDPVRDGPVDTGKSKDPVPAKDGASDLTKDKTSDLTPKTEPPKEPTKDPKEPGNDPPKEAPKEPPVKPAIDQVPMDQPKPDKREIGKYTAKQRVPSLLYVRAGAAEPWKRVASGNQVSTTDQLLSLPGSHSEVQLDNQVKLTLWGNWPESREFPPLLESAAVLYVPDTGSDVDLRLDHGRVVLENQKPQGQAHVRVRFYERERWDLTLDRQTAVALEVWGRYPADVPFSKKPGGEGPMVVMGVFVLQGQAALKIGYQEYALPPGSWYVWDNIGPSTRRPQPAPPNFTQWWVNRNATAQTDEKREMNAAITDLAQRIAKTPDVAIDKVLDAVFKDKKAKPASRILAVYCLGACDAPGLLMDALNDSRSEVRETAVLALRHWTSLTADHDLKLYELLQSKEKGYTEHQADIIMAMLHSPSEEMMRKPELYDALTAYLRNEKQAIRQLAWWHLSRLVPDEAKAAPYDPAGPSAQREQAVKQWQKLIRDGKVPPPRPRAIPQ